MERAEKESAALYNSYLKGMFAASAKSRLDFYKSTLAETGIQMSLEDAEFGDEALILLQRSPTRTESTS